MRSMCRTGPLSHCRCLDEGHWGWVVVLGCPALLLTGWLKLRRWQEQCPFALFPGGASLSSFASSTSPSGVGGAGAGCCCSWQKCRQDCPMDCPRDGGRPRGGCSAPRPRQASRLESRCHLPVGMNRRHFAQLVRSLFQQEFASGGLDLVAGLLSMEIETSQQLWQIGN